MRGEWRVAGDRAQEGETGRQAAGAPDLPLPEAASLRLAYFSPLPPARSGIADYSRELLTRLAQRARVDVFSADPAAVDPALRQQVPLYPLDHYPRRRWQYDVALYQMGNSAHHEAIYRLLRRYPGVVVLHDLVLHHFIADRTAGRGDYPGYVRELAYAGGAAGIHRAWAIHAGEAPHPLATVPLNERVVDLSLGAIVHSRYAQRRLQVAQPARPVHAVPAPVAVRPGRPRRDALPWPEDALIFASLGQVTASRRLDEALRAFARLHERQPQARYLIAGELLPDADVAGAIKALGLGEWVHVTGYVDGLQAFVDWAATADVVVNLRRPTLGETSATALRALAAGRALVVSDHGWYAELPDAVAVKVPPGDEGALLAALERLAREPERRARLGDAARAYVVAEHDPGRVADAYLEAIGEILRHVVARGAYG